MGRGKFQKKERRIPLMAWILAGMAMLGMFTGGVVAYLAYSSDSLINTFTPDTEYDPVILEAFSGEKKEKKEVKVSVPAPKPTEDAQKYAVYVRAAVVVTWRRGETEPEQKEVLLAAAPAKTDYTLDWNDTEWFLKDGFYYHKAPVNPGGVTAVLINSCKPNIAKEGYVLNVEVITQTIQANGTTDVGGVPAVTDAWGVEVDESGQLKPAPTT